VLGRDLNPFPTEPSYRNKWLEEVRAGHFRVKGRENFYLAIREIQRDLDEFMTYYNLERSHQGYRLNGRTPAQALREALGIAELPNLRFETAADALLAADQPDARETDTEPETI
jgi:hypothetical protein